MITVRDRAGLRLGQIDDQAVSIPLREVVQGFVMMDGEYRMEVSGWAGGEFEFTFQPEGSQVIGDVVHVQSFVPDPVFLESRRMKLQPVARALGRPRGRAIQL